MFCSPTQQKDVVAKRPMAKVLYILNPVFQQSSFAVSPFWQPPCAGALQLLGAAERTWLAPSPFLLYLVTAVKTTCTFLEYSTVNSVLYFVSAYILNFWNLYFSEHPVKALSFRLRDDLINNVFICSIIVYTTVSGCLYGALRYFALTFLSI